MCLGSCISLPAPRCRWWRAGAAQLVAICAAVAPDGTQDAAREREEEARAVLNAGP